MNATLTDLNRRELAVMGVIAAVIIWLGVAPGPVLRRMQATSAHLVETVQQRAALASAAALESSAR